MKKKLLTIGIITVLVCSLLACGSNQTEDDNNDKSQQEGTEVNSQEVLDQLTKKLQISVAWDAVVAYGQQEYGDFAVRNMPGQPVDEIAEDASTWCLTAPCTVNGESMTCEAKVTGTTENPEVLSFKVY